ncbi:hypothetical protein QAD02_009554 [Eretmocerus hayati]|uniref:Uncharacterized protein n=1 Tax=Eretmocerus hayati TaxID=131215 RepID=A0ACC2NAF2_9HYME|nr:hypothetical protein QAD02_009554 [Eretmocerus hayati]
MDLLTIILLLLLGWLAYRYIKKQGEYFKDRGVPYTPGSSILNKLIMPFIVPFMDVQTQVKEVYKKGPIDAKYFGFFESNGPITVIRDIELIKNITVKHFDNFPDHRTLVDVEMDPLFGRNLFLIRGDEWRHSRKFLGQFFTSSKMKGMFDLVKNCTERMIKHLDETPNPKVISSKILFSKQMNDAIASCAFGIAVDSFQDPNNEFFLRSSKSTNFNETKMAMKFTLAGSAPWLMKLLKIRIVPDDTRLFFEDLVKSVIDTRAKQEIRRPDLIQMMIDARDSTDSNVTLDVPEMTAKAFIFLFGGLDTTSTQLCIITHELALNPDVQESLYSEVAPLLLSSNPITYDILMHSTPYLDAVIRESLRKHPIVPMLERVCLKPYQLPPATPESSPLVIQPGDTIWIPVAGLYNDDKLFPDPESFKPERFIERKRDEELGNWMGEIGFGLGPRQCIGSRFAQMQMKLTIAHLVARYRLGMKDDSSKKFEYARGVFTPVPKGGFWIKVERRES